METGQKITQQKTNIDALSSNILSIQVSLNGLSFCILDTDQNSISYYRSESFKKKLNPQELLEQLQLIYLEDDLESKTVKTVKVIYENELSVLVPNSLLNEDHLADYLKFNTRILQTDFITYDTMNTNDSVCVYVPYVNINNFLYEKYGAFEYKHFATILIESILSMEKNATSMKMYAHVSKDHFEIIVVEANKLKLYNTFDYQTKEDFIYYILFTSEQLQLNPESIELILLGSIKKDDELYKIAYKYVRNVSVLDQKLKYELALNVSDEIQHNFILLNNL